MVEKSQMITIVNFCNAKITDRATSIETVSVKSHRSTLACLGCAKVAQNFLDDFS